MAEPLVVLHEDAHCLVVAKPAGILTQGTAGGEATLETAVRRYLSPESPGSVYLGTVHRLDRPVSGVVVWARTPKAARRLASQFARREARKEYWAVVERDPSMLPIEGLWDDWLTDVGPGGVARVVGPETPGARRAVTRFRKGSPLRLPSGSTWLCLWPETGRTHQLRAQAAARGMPIVGDLNYGASGSLLDGIALHARVLEVRHPVTRLALVWTAPLPPAWEAQGFILL